MTEKKGVAGRSTRDMANRRRQQVLIKGLLAIGIMIVLTIVLQSGVFRGSVVTVVIFFLILFIPDIIGKQLKTKNKTAERAWRGAEAEEAIANILENLGEGFFVLHDISTPYGNIDHIVISKKHGVFLIETKAHSGKVTVINGELKRNGKPFEKDFVRQILRNVFWLKETIEDEIGIRVWITPILVFANAYVPPLRPIKNVRIINRRFLRRTIYQTSASPQKSSQLWEKRYQLAQIL